MVFEAFLFAFRRKEHGQKLDFLKQFLLLASLICLFYLGKRLPADYEDFHIGHAVCVRLSLLGSFFQAKPLRKVHCVQSKHAESVPD